MERATAIPNETLLPPKEGLDAVTANHLRGRPEDFPYPEEVDEHGHRRSSKLKAFWDATVTATEYEMERAFATRLL